VVRAFPIAAIYLTQAAPARLAWTGADEAVVGRGLVPRPSPRCPTGGQRLAGDGCLGLAASLSGVAGAKAKGAVRARALQRATTFVPSRQLVPTANFSELHGPVPHGGAKTSCGWKDDFQLLDKRPRCW
jgi:hypothetical protein